MIVKTHISNIRLEAKRAYMTDADVDIEQDGHYCRLGGMTIRGLAFVGRMGAKYDRPERVALALLLDTDGNPRYTRARLSAETRRRAGCKALRICRSTGTLVGLYEAEPANLDTDDGAWATVCETHGGIVMHQTRAIAESHLSHPEEWCPVCQGDEEEENYAVKLRYEKENGSPRRYK